MIQNSPKEEKVQIREVMRVFIKKAKINVSLIRERDFKDRVKKKKNVGFGLFGSFRYSFLDRCDSCSVTACSFLVMVLYRFYSPIYTYE